MKKEFNKSEYNKMCAEFLGWELKSYPSYMDTPFSGQRLWFSPTSSDGKTRTFSARVGEEYFDTDWNWIMELVEAVPQKVQGINVSIHPNSCLITDTGVRGKYSLNASKNIVMIIDAQNRKEAVIQAIWEFLNWYNEQKQ